MTRPYWTTTVTGADEDGHPSTTAIEVAVEPNPERAITGKRYAVVVRIVTGGTPISTSSEGFAVLAEAREWAERRADDAWADYRRAARRAARLRDPRA
jgi:hypothetical protein